MQVEDAGVRIESGWLFKVPRGAINDVSFSLPKELKVRSISGPDVGGWELARTSMAVCCGSSCGERLAIKRRWHSSYFWRLAWPTKRWSINVPTFAPLQVTRDFGVVGLFAAPQFAIKNIATKGLTQINAESVCVAVALAHVANRTVERVPVPRLGRLTSASRRSGEHQNRPVWPSML